MDLSSNRAAVTIVLKFGTHVSINNLHLCVKVFADEISGAVRKFSGGGVNPQSKIFSGNFFFLLKQIDRYFKKLKKEHNS